MAWSEQARKAAAEARRRNSVNRIVAKNKAGVKAHRKAGISGLDDLMGGLNNRPTKVPSKPAPAKAKSAIAEIHRFNQHGPVGGKEPYLKASPYVSSRPASGVKRPVQPKKRKKNNLADTDHLKWKAGWGMGSG